MASVEVAEKSGNKESLALPLFNLAKVQDELGEHKEAISNYRLAISNLEKNPPKVHRVEERSAIMADFKMHLTTAEFNAGDSTAIKRAEEALKELEKGTEISEYNKKVWVSGAHMNLTLMYKDLDQPKAMLHLNEAKKIINSDERLVLRKKQWNKLAALF
jgi:tetratricopeptide (TPR) repeat protein